MIIFYCWHMNYRRRKVLCLACQACSTLQLHPDMLVVWGFELLAQCELCLTIGAFRSPSASACPDKPIRKPSLRIYHGQAGSQTMPPNVPFSSPLTSVPALWGLSSSKAYPCDQGPPQFQFDNKCDANVCDYIGVFHLAVDGLVGRMITPLKSLCMSSRHSRLLKDSELSSARTTSI
jgi:hypothetical protein